MRDNYEDIINLPHHVSTTHTPMSMESRAAQFAPFAALTGHDDAIEDTASDAIQRMGQEIERIPIEEQVGEGITVQTLELPKI